MSLLSSLNVCPQLGKSTTSPQRQPERQVAIGTLVLSCSDIRKLYPGFILHLLNADNKDCADAFKRKTATEKEGHIEYSILKK